MFQEINLDNLNVNEMKSLCRAFDLPYRLRRAELQQQLQRFLRIANEVPIVEVAAAAAVEDDNQLRAVDNQLRNNNKQSKSFLARVFGTGRHMENCVRKIYYLLPERSRVGNRLQQCLSSMVAALGVIGGLYALSEMALFYSMPSTTIQAEIKFPRFW